MIKSIYPVICANDVTRARDFYVGLFDLRVVYESDFYVQLHGGDESVQLGIVTRGHESVPAGFRDLPRGVLASFEVADIAPYHARALRMNVTMALTLRDEVFGQRHFIAIDPEGLMVDVIELIPFAAEEAVYIKDQAARA